MKKINKKSETGIEFNFVSFISLFFSFLIVLGVIKIGVSIFNQEETNLQIATSQAYSIGDFIETSKKFQSDKKCYNVFRLENSIYFQNYKEKDKYFLVIKKDKVLVYDFEKYFSKFKKGEEVDEKKSENYEKPIDFKIELKILKEDSFFKSFFSNNFFSNEKIKYILFYQTIDEGIIDKLIYKVDIYFDKDGKIEKLDINEEAKILNCKFGSSTGGDKKADVIEQIQNCEMEDETKIKENLNYFVVDNEKNFFLTYDGEDEKEITINRNLCSNDFLLKGIIEKRFELIDNKIKTLKKNKVENIKMLKNLISEYENIEKLNDDSFENLCKNKNIYIDNKQKDFNQLFLIKKGKKIDNNPDEKIAEDLCEKIISFEKLKNEKEDLVNEIERLNNINQEEIWFKKKIIINGKDYEFELWKKEDWSWDIWFDKYKIKINDKEYEIDSENYYLLYDKKNVKIDLQNPLIKILNGEIEE